MPRKRYGPATVSAERTVLITRVFDAPRHLVFEAWTDPEALKRWTTVTLHQTVSEPLAKRTGAHPSWIQMRSGGAR